MTQTDIEVEALKAKLAAVTSWQPMTTALKDRHILLSIEGRAIEGWWAKDYNRFEVVSLPSHGCGCCSGSNDKPDGWMELPK